MKYTIDGAPAYLYAAVGGVAAVSAAPKSRGGLLWKSADWNVQVVAPSPLLMPGNEILFTAGYGAGSMVMKAGGGTVKTLYARAPGSGMASEQQTPILFQNLLFGILPKDAGELHNQFVCMTPAGTVIWSSGKTDRYGLGPYLAADGKFFILGDDGTLYAVRATQSGYQKLGSAALLEGRGVDAWGPMALAGALMVLRDSTRLLCVDLSLKE
jgi:outer membrane protein assembly factor BamB